MMGGKEIRVDRADSEGDGERQRERDREKSRDRERHRQKERAVQSCVNILYRPICFSGSVNRGMTSYLSFTKVYRRIHCITSGISTATDSLHRISDHNVSCAYYFTNYMGLVTIVLYTCTQAVFIQTLYYSLYIYIYAQS